MSVKRVVLIVCMVSLLCITPSNVSAESNDAVFYATSWNGMANDYLHTVDLIFDAIERKHQTEFIDALEAFISLDRRNPENETVNLTTCPVAAHAIYTVAKLGGSNIEEEFEKLLREPMISDKPILYMREQFKEKAKALRYMHKLGIHSRPETVEQLKHEMLHGKEFEPVIKLAEALCFHEVEFSADEKMFLQEQLTRNWNSVDLVVVQSLGIQPDWISLFEVLPQDKKVELMHCLLKIGDEENRQAYLDSVEDIFAGEGKSKHVKIAIAASVGNEEALEYLRTSNDLKCLLYITYFLERCPDDILLLALKAFSVESNFVPGVLLLELEKRGYEREVSKVIEHAKSILIAGSLEYAKFWETNKYRRTGSFRSFWEKIRLDSRKREEKFKKENAALNAKMKPVTSLLDYDAGICLDAISKQFENHGYDYYSQFIIDLVWFDMIKNLYGHIISPRPGIMEWVNRNPEIMVRIIQAELKKPAYKEWDFGSGWFPKRIVYRTPLQDMAFLTMLCLPNDVFQKHFFSLEKKYEPHLTRGDDWDVDKSFLVGTYFKADWHYDVKLIRKYGLPNLN